MSDQTAGKIPVGISACLTGQKVRYNGGHKQSRYCLDVLQDCFEFKTFCPEVAAGLGIPRERYAWLACPMNCLVHWAPMTPVWMPLTTCWRSAPSLPAKTETCAVLY